MPVVGPRQLRRWRTWSNERCTCRPHELYPQLMVECRACLARRLLKALGAEERPEPEPEGGA